MPAATKKAAAKKSTKKPAAAKATKKATVKKAATKKATKTPQPKYPAGSGAPAASKRATKVETETRTHKTCSVCKESKPLDQYYRPQRDCRCKPCSTIYSRELRARKKAEAEKAAKAAKRNGQKV